MHVHFLYPLEVEQQELLDDKLVDGVNYSSGAIQEEQYGTAILVAGRPTKEDLDKLPDLKRLFIPWTGIPEETRAVLIDFPDLQVHNLHHNAAPAAELALSLLMAGAKQIIPFDRSLRNGNWQPRYQNRMTILLSGKKALVIGYGAIGKRIEQGLEGLGIEVRLMKRDVDQDEEEKSVFTPDNLHQLLPETDFLILALPLTDQTEDLIGEKELTLLPTSAILVNVSRGKIVNQKALFKALKEKRIFSAGLDVWYNYPDSKETRENTFPGDFPFHELDNIVLSPHRGGLVMETETMRIKSLAAMINAAARGEQVPNAVSLIDGY